MKYGMDSLSPTPSNPRNPQDAAKPVALDFGDDTLAARRAVLDARFGYARAGEFAAVLDAYVRAIRERCAGLLDEDGESAAAAKLRELSNA